jgi:hypothetical protein
MSLRNRACAEYLDGLKSFIRAAEADMLNQHKTSMWCPCIDCGNQKQYSSSLSVHAHLIIRGFMGDYRCWNKHGEEGVNDRDLQAGRMDQGFSGDPVRMMELMLLVRTARKDPFASRISLMTS